MAYKTVIGLELHCELNTASKVFTPSKNEYTDLANSMVTPGDLAMPGILPVLNKEALKKSIKMAMCLNCEIPKEVMFDRKNYFYPDLPSSCQITQDTKPIGINGYIVVNVNGEDKRIGINNIHLEEDTASLDHYFDYSLINYNRSVVPLIEIVTEPCIHDADTAVVFLENLRSIFKYADISEADTKKGQIRCDVNISLMEEGSKEFGTRVEIKNINSFSNVHDAIKYEIKRQTELLNAGKHDEIIQETRRYDDTTGSTISMRKKETEADYRYYIEPNIPVIKLDKEWLDEIRSSIPMLPNERRKLYIDKYLLNDYDAGVLVKDKMIADYFEKCVELSIGPKAAANWVSVNILGYINKHEIDMKDFFLTPDMLKVIIDAINKGDISSKQAKEIFFKVLEDKKHPKEYISSENAMLSDEDELNNIIKNILTEYSNQVEQYKSGKDNLFDFFVGQVMKETRGKANPVITKKILMSELNKS